MDLQNAHKSGETETEESWVAIWGGSCGWVQEADQKGTSHHESGEVDREVVLALMFPWAPSGHACTHHHCSACRNIAASPGLPAEGNPQGSTESWVESRCQGRRLPSFLPSGAREEVGSSGAHGEWLGPDALWPDAQAIAYFLCLFNLSPFFEWVCTATWYLLLIQV